MRVQSWILAIICVSGATGCATGPVSVFLHDEDAIRINHSTGQEQVLRRGIRPEFDDGDPLTDDVLDAYPLLYSQHRTNICPAGQVQGIVGCFPAPDANWCVITSWINGQDHTRGPFRRDLPLSSGSIDLRDMDFYCPYDVATTPSQSVIAASLLLQNSQSESRGILITRINDKWKGHTNIPGWSELRPVRNSALNTSGTSLCFELDGEVRCGSPSDPASATICGDGTLPMIAEVGGNDSVAWLQNGRFRAAPLSGCASASFSSSPIPPGTVVSTDGHENSSTIVYLLDTASGTDLYEYSFRTNTHTRVLSDSRRKTSVSLVIN